MFESDYALIGKHATYTKRLNEAECLLDTLTSI